MGVAVKKSCAAENVYAIFYTNTRNVLHLAFAGFVFVFSKSDEHTRDRAPLKKCTAQNMNAVEINSIFHWHIICAL